MKKLIFLLLIISLFSACSEKNYVKENYDKSIYKIEMRDGVKLFTIVYSPKDKSKNYPIMFYRTPYSIHPYEKDEYRKMIAPSEIMQKEKFIFVYQDVRGKFMSEGKFVNMRPMIKNSQTPTNIDEATDTYDSIDWLIKNIKNNNGKVGMWGISYPGFYAAVGAMSNHPALKAVSPQAPISDWFVDDDFHHNGAFSLSMGFSFFSSFGQDRDSLTTQWGKNSVKPDANQYDFYLNKVGALKNVNDKYFHNEIPFWDSIMVHQNYDGFWKSRSTLDDFQKVQTAVMTVGGWFDSEDLFGPLKTYKAIENNNPNQFNILVMGPWSHGGWARTDGKFLGEVNFAQFNSKFYQEEIEYPFFMHYLKDAEKPNLPEAIMFNTGKNEWKKFETWPPKNIEEKYLYLNSDSSITFDSEKENGELKYISDPQNPVPYSNQIKDLARYYPRSYMVEDQRFLNNRKDILAFTSQPIEKEITFAGEVLANLVVSLSTSDADFVVKLIDVYPDDYKDADGKPQGGYEQLVRWDIIRGRFRNSLENPEAFEPNKKTHVDFLLQDILHTFRKGHKIKIQIQSSFFPFFDRNPQQFIDISKAEDSDFIKSEITIFTGKEESKIIFKQLSE